MASQTDINELLDLSKCFRCYSAADQLAIQTYIIANSRSLTDPSTLLELAKDFAGVSTRRLLSIISYLLADIGNLDTDADALAERAICYSCVPAESLTAIQTYLLSIDPSAPDATTSELLDLAACFRCLSLRDNLKIQAYILALNAGGSTDPGTLAEQAACLDCLSYPVLASAVTDVLNYLEDGTGDTGGGGGIGGGVTPTCDENVAPTITNPVYGTNAVGETNVLLTFDAGTLCVCDGAYPEWVFYGSQSSDGSSGVEFNSLPIAGGGAFAENVAMPLTSPPYLYVYITVRCTGFESPISNVISAYNRVPLAVGDMAYDTMESYANGVDVNFLSGGVNWSGPYQDKESYKSIIAYDSLESYNNGDPVSGLNGGTGDWASAYVV